MSLDNRMLHKSEVARGLWRQKLLFDFKKFFNYFLHLFELMTELKIKDSEDY